MASAHTLTHVRSVRCALAALAVVAATLSALQPSAAAQPALPPTPSTVSAVTQQLDRLGQQQEALAEKYNLAQIEVAAKRKEAAAAQQKAALARAEFVKARGQFTQVVTGQYESPSFSAAGALLTSQDGTSYLDKMSQLNLLAAHRGTLIAELNTAKGKADAAQRIATTLLTQMNAQLTDIGKQRDTLLAQHNKLQAALAKLTLAQQEAYRAARDAVPPAAAKAAAPAPRKGSPAASVAAQKVVDFAIAQVGKPYVFAGAGPDAYDCSGLVMAAYGQVGISLPHNARTQYDYGTHVSVSDLQPGDVIFMYSPIGHDEIYIGNGISVSAANEALGIRYISVANDLPDITGVTRLL